MEIKSRILQATQQGSLFSKTLHLHETLPTPLNMQLPYPAFLHVPALQWAGSDLGSGCLSLSSIPGLASVAGWPQLKGSWARCMCCPAEWGTHPRIPFSSLRLRVQKPSYCFPWIVLHPLGYHVQGKHLLCPQKSEHFGVCPQGEFQVLGRGVQISERPTSRPHPKWHVLATLGSVHYLVLRLAHQSLNHCP